MDSIHITYGSEATVKTQMKELFHLAVMVVATLLNGLMTKAMPVFEDKIEVPPLGTKTRVDYDHVPVEFARFTELFDIMARFYILQNSLNSKLPEEIGDHNILEQNPEELSEGNGVINTQGQIPDALSEVYGVLNTQEQIPEELSKDNGILNTQEQISAELSEDNGVLNTQGHIPAELSGLSGVHNTKEHIQGELPLETGIHDYRKHKMSEHSSRIDVFEESLAVLNEDIKEQGDKRPHVVAVEDIHHNVVSSNVLVPENTPSGSGTTKQKANLTPKNKNLVLNKDAFMNVAMPMSNTRHRRDTMPNMPDSLQHVCHTPNCLQMLKQFMEWRKQNGYPDYVGVWKVGK